MTELAEVSFSLPLQPPSELSVMVEEGMKTHHHEGMLPQLIQKWSMWEFTQA